MQLAAEYPVQVVYRALDYARSSFYYAAQGSSKADFETELKRVAGEWPTYGYRRLNNSIANYGSASIASESDAVCGN
jgi:hypothetical protein